MTTWDQWQADVPPEGMCDSFRLFLADLRRKNRLLGGMEQLDEDELIQALKLSLGDWRITPPLVNQQTTFESHPSVLLLFLRASVEAHRMVGQSQTANQLTYSDGGINVAVNDKTVLNQSWMNTALGEYEQKKRQYMTSANLEGMYGKTWSEYASLANRGGI